MAIKISGSNIIDDNRHIVSAGVITATRAVFGTSGGVGVATITSGGIDAVGLAITTTTIKVGSAISITDSAISATRFFGDGTGLSNTGSSLSAASGTQRVVVTSQTSGTMTASATDADLTFDASTNTLAVGGNLELGHATDTTISRVSAGRIAVEGVNVVTTSSTDTLTNKTLTSPLLTAPVETLNAAGNTGVAQTLTLANGNFVTSTLTGNCTFTFSMTGVNSSNAYSFTLVLANDATAGRTITWPASVKWPNATVPTRTTTAGKTDVYTFFTYDGGTTWWGNLSLYNFS